MTFISERSERRKRAPEVELSNDATTEPVPKGWFNSWRNQRPSFAQRTRERNWARLRLRGITDAALDVAAFASCPELGEAINELADRIEDVIVAQHEADSDAVQAWRARQPRA